MEEEDPEEDPSEGELMEEEDPEEDPKKREPMEGDDPEEDSEVSGGKLIGSEDLERDSSESETEG